MHTTMHFVFYSTALIAWGREYKWDRVDFNEFDVILTRFDTFLIILILFDISTCLKFQERVFLFVNNKKQYGVPAGFRPGSGRKPAGIRSEFKAFLEASGAADLFC